MGRDGTGGERGKEQSWMGEQEINGCVHGGTEGRESGEGRTEHAREGEDWATAQFPSCM